jgi:hypothetical protein
VVNPDGMIVRANAARADAALRFDAPYAASLSADAVPPLLAALPKVHPVMSCVAAERVLARWDQSDTDWRTWSLSRGRARAAVAAHRQELRSMTPCTPLPPLEIPTVVATMPAASAATTRSAEGSATPAQPAAAVPTAGAAAEPRRTP